MITEVKPDESLGNGAVQMSVGKMKHLGGGGWTERVSFVSEMARHRAKREAMSWESSAGGGGRKSKGGNTGLTASGAGGGRVLRKKNS